MILFKDVSDLSVCLVNNLLDMEQEDLDESPVEWPDHSDPSLNMLYTYFQVMIVRYTAKLLTNKKQQLDSSSSIPFVPFKSFSGNVHIATSDPHISDFLTQTIQEEFNYFPVRKALVSLFSVVPGWRELVHIRQRDVSSEEYLEEFVMNLLVQVMDNSLDNVDVNTRSRLLFD